MFALPISMLRFKSIIFYQNSPRIKLLLQKNAKFFSAGGSAPRHSCLWQLGTLRPDPQNTPPHCKFLATRLITSNPKQLQIKKSQPYYAL